MHHPARPAPSAVPNVNAKLQLEAPFASRFPACPRKGNLHKCALWTRLTSIPYLTLSKTQADVVHVANDGRIETVHPSRKASDCLKTNAWSKKRRSPKMIEASYRINLLQIVLKSLGFHANLKTSFTFFQKQPQISPPTVHVV